MKKVTSVLAAFLVFLSVFAAGTTAQASDDVLILSNCDTEDGWVAIANGLPALTLDTENKTEGKASVGATAPNGKLNHILYKPEQPIDISGYKYIEFDMYFDDMTWFIDCTGVMVELTSSGTCDIESHRYMKGVLGPNFENNAIEGKPGWYHIKLNIQEPHAIANGGCNLKRFNYFRFYSVDPISTTPDYTMRIDNIMFTNNEDPVVEETPEPTAPAETDEPSETITPEPTETTDPDETENPDETADPTETTKPVETDPAGNDDRDGDGSSGTVMIIVIAAVALAVLGIGGFALYKFVLKK